MMNKSDLKTVLWIFCTNAFKKNKFIKESKKKKDFYQDLFILFNEEKYSALINKVEPVLSQFKKSFKILHILLGGFINPRRIYTSRKSFNIRLVYNQIMQK